MAIKALVFDAYGTLYDVHSVQAKTEELCPGKRDLITQIWRLKQLEYTWLQTSQADTVKLVYTPGHSKPELISPDNWNMDLRYLDRPNARRVQLDFFYDYRTNVELYPKWQAFLREQQPKTIIFWGQEDIFFTREGGESYLKDDAPIELGSLRRRRFARLHRQKKDESVSQKDVSERRVEAACK
jgi:hypothetical protein